MKKVNLRKLIFCAMLTCLATLAFYLENLFPPLFLPGARLGLSNVFVLLSVVLLGYFYGLSALVVKIILGSLFSGNISTIMYSLPAGIIALSLQTVVLFYAKKTSILSASVLGAVINSAIQNIVFCLATNTLQFLCYLPYLTLVAVLSGLTVGFIVYLALKYIPITIFIEKEN